MDHSTLNFSRKIQASPDHVFHCLTDPASRQIWNSPGEGAVFQITSNTPITAGMRETGQVGPADNPYVTVHADWIITDPGKSLTYAETLEADGTPLTTSLAVTELTADGDHTQLDLHVHVVSFTGPDSITEVTEGWNFAVDAMVAFAQGDTTPN